MKYTGYQAIFEEKDRGKTILIPWFTDFLSPMIPAVARIAGYKFVNCPKTSKSSTDIGLKYGNNEVCYPATLVLGDLIAEIQTGKYDLDDLAVAITQTGGQCRATNYLAFIKMGLKNAGLEQIPVVSVATGGVHQNEQPGFSIPFRKIAGIAINAFLFGDMLNQLFSAAVARGTQPERAQELFDKYMQLGVETAERNDKKGFLPLLEKAVVEFNEIPLVEGRKVEKIGLIGEIFVKYNSYGQAHITEWLRQEGFEVVTPPMIHFFLQTFVNTRVNVKNGIRQKTLSQKITMPIIYRLLNRKIKQYDKVFARSKFYSPLHSIFDIAGYASDIIDLSNQFGEGWLIAGDVANFSHQGINRVVCVQPFGCIANHVVAKGIERRIKDVYPDMNLLFLDIDGGMAEVNLHNRLKFLMH